MSEGRKSRLGELERAIMDRLWAAPGPMTVREVHTDLLAERSVAYTTVMTVLDRLARKGVARQIRTGRAYNYEPALTREQIVTDLLSETLQDSCAGPDDRAAALMHFVGHASSADRAALRAALTELESTTGGQEGAPA